MELPSTNYTSFTGLVLLPPLKPSPIPSLPGSQTHTKPGGTSQTLCAHRRPYVNLATPPAYYEYITRAHKVLLEHPCREAVTNHIFLEPSYKGKACQTCWYTLLGLPEFSRLLGDEVERRVSEVRHFIAYLLNTSHSIEGQSRVAILTFSGLST